MMEDPQWTFAEQILSEGWRDREPCSIARLSALSLPVPMVEMTPAALSSVPLVPEVGITRSFQASKSGVACLKNAGTGSGFKA